MAKLVRNENNFCSHEETKKKRKYVLRNKNANAMMVWFGVVLRFSHIKSQCIEKVRVPKIPTLTLAYLPERLTQLTTLLSSFLSLTFCPFAIQHSEFAIGLLLGLLRTYGRNIWITFLGEMRIKGSKEILQRYGRRNLNDISEEM